MCVGYDDSVAIGSPFVRLVYRQSAFWVPIVGPGVPSESYAQSVHLMAGLFVNTPAPNGVRTAHSPRMGENSSPHYTGWVGVNAQVGLRDSDCGLAVPTVYFSTPPNNQGNPQDVTLSAYEVFFNSSSVYGPGGLCRSPREVAVHELGHTLGLGDTSNQAQVMAAQGFGGVFPHKGDLAGIRCMYENLSSTYNGVFFPCT